MDRDLITTHNTCVQVPLPTKTEQSKQTVSLLLKDIKNVDQRGYQDGFTCEELVEAAKNFNDAEIVDLREMLDPSIRADAEPACILVVRGGINQLGERHGFTADELQAETNGLTPDAQHYIRRLRFDEEAHDADLADGVPTVIAYDDVPVFKAARESLSDKLGKKAQDLPSCSGNFYSDAADSGVGWHGDS